MHVTFFKILEKLSFEKLSQCVALYASAFSRDVVAYFNGFKIEDLHFLQVCAKSSPRVSSLCSQRSTISGISFFFIHCFLLRVRNSYIVPAATKVVYQAPPRMEHYKSIIICIGRGKRTICKARTLYVNLRSS